MGEDCGGEEEEEEEEKCLDTRAARLARGDTLKGIREEDGDNEVGEEGEYEEVETEREEEEEGEK